MKLIEIKRNIRSAWHHTTEALPPPEESKRTRQLICSELHFATAHPKLEPFRGLATTLCVATFSFYNGFHYLGREAVRAIKARKLSKTERPPCAWRPIISSFLLSITSLLYLVYSLATLGIGPYFTNRFVCNFLLFSDPIDRITQRDLGPPTIEEVPPTPSFPP